MPINCLHFVRKSFAILAAVSLVAFGTDAARAGGPWERATGEAVELRRTTEDLRNRLERLFHGSPAAAWAVQTDELAKQIKTTTDSYVSKPEFDSLIESFCVARDNTVLYIGTDPYIAGDERIRDYLEEVDERLERFVKDLSKAKVPAMTHYAPGGYAMPAHPSRHHDSHDHHPRSYAVPQYEVRPYEPHVGMESYGQSYRPGVPYSAGRIIVPNAGQVEHYSYPQPTYRQGIELRVPPVAAEPRYAVPRIAF